MNVKDKKRGRPAGGKEGFSKEAIIRTANTFMLDSGKVPSIRQLASILQVDAMAIYYYFKSKDILLEEVTISLINEIYQPTNLVSWEIELEQLCISYLNLLTQYSGLLETLLGMTSVGPTTVFRDRFLKIICNLKLDDEMKKHCLNLLVDYLHGFALAMNNNRSKDPLLLDDIKGPISLICKIMG